MYANNPIGDIGSVSTGFDNSGSLLLKPVDNKLLFPDDFKCYNTAATGNTYLIDALRQGRSQ
jgi:hypothetical protein